MVIHLHEKFYRSNATQLSESDIKEIRESRGKIPILSSSDQPALDKNFQTDKTEQTLEATEIPKKNARKKKVKIDGKPVTEATSMVEKNNKNGVASFSDNSSDTSREDRAESLLENLVNRGKILKGLTANTTPLI